MGGAENWGCVLVSADGVATERSGPGKVRLFELLHTRESLTKGATGDTDNGAAERDGMGRGNEHPSLSLGTTIHSTSQLLRVRKKKVT
jgi:hypothetical protein